MGDIDPLPSTQETFKNICKQMEIKADECILYEKFLKWAIKDFELNIMLQCLRNRHHGIEIFIQLHLFYRGTLNSCIFIITYGVIIFFIILFI